jgi:hypothetical protein
MRRGRGGDKKIIYGGDSGICGKFGKRVIWEKGAERRGERSGGCRTLGRARG